jgi:hypothetical protein
MLLLSLVVLVAAGSAQAGYWAVQYDLAGSNLETVNPGGTYNNAVTGTLNVEYDATSSVAPLLGGRLVSGTIDGTIDQDAGLLYVTGANSNVLNPGMGGTPGTLSGDKLNLAVIADHNVTGYLHCADATGPGGFCSTFFGTPASNNIPQTGTGPFTLPPLTFTATAGVGDFIGGPVVSAPQASVTTSLTYVGQEVSRTWVEDAVPVIGTGGLVALLGGLLLTGLAVARRSLA